jgi:hypothetical protein
VNAALSLIRGLPRHSLQRVLGKLDETEQASESTERLQARLGRQVELDLALLLNQLTKEELQDVARIWKVEAPEDMGELRAALWQRGAVREAGSDAFLGSEFQPVPETLRQKLVFVGPIRGLMPECVAWPRPVPEPVPVPAPGPEPDCLEELLERANALVGCRLGARGRDKGAHGTRVAILLGLAESGFSEPDWRGDVEVKTLPVVRDRNGLWRVKEDPAVSMDGVRPLAKLSRVLWIARIADEEDSPILSWYYQEWDAAIAAMVKRHLHKRPKGPKGTDRKGWYLRKHFFTESGFLRSLNGPTQTANNLHVPHVSWPVVPPHHGDSL